MARRTAGSSIGGRALFIVTYHALAVGACRVTKLSLDAIDSCTFSGSVQSSDIDLTGAQASGNRGNFGCYEKRHSCGAFRIWCTERVVGDSLYNNAIRGVELCQAVRTGAGSIIAQEFATIVPELAENHPAEDSP